MKVISLQSGSNGNCFYIEAGGTGVLVDAGISGKRAEERLATHGIDIRSCRALFISHDHRDHASKMGVFHRKFGLPVYVTRTTYHAASRYAGLGVIGELRHFRSGETIDIPTETDNSPLRVHTLSTPHDGADCVVFILEYRGQKVGILSDLGHVFDELVEAVASLDAVVIESNYDPQMLDASFYPDHLKSRIRGNGGHLSNDESAALVRSAVAERRLQWSAVCHLSGENNSVGKALEAHRRHVGQHIPVHVASREGVSDVWKIES